MTVKEMIDWLKDKPLDSEIVKSYKNEPWLFIEIGLKHKGISRRDTNAEQRELF